MPERNDSDIKIYGKTGDDNCSTDLLEAAEYLNRQRRFGNITKAKTLGEALAALDPEKGKGFKLSDLADRQPELTPTVLHQIRALIVFLAQTALHQKFGAQPLSSCAVNAMYDKLIEISPDFYDSICDGAAFTFYSLSLKEEDVCTDIGRHFAMLCGMEGNKEYIAFGCNIFKNAGQMIADIIDAYKFEKID
ncbi:MAG TPA: hypothetical protein VFD23_06135 [Clostridia bacterium]|nr:hypothetical protein [Clostridia bacterium]